VWRVDRPFWPNIRPIQELRCRRWLPYCMLAVSTPSVLSTVSGCYLTGVQIKKLLLVALVCARWRVDCVTRRLCDELTGSRFNTVCITQYQIQQQQRFEMTASITCPIKQASQSDTIHWHTARAGQSSNYFTNDKIGIMTCHINAILHSHATTYTWLSQLLLWWWWLMMKSTKWFFNLWQSSITLIKPHSYFS